MPVPLPDVPVPAPLPVVAGAEPSLGTAEEGGLSFSAGAYVRTKGVGTPGGEAAAPAGAPKRARRLNLAMAGAKVRERGGGEGAREGEPGHGRGRCRPRGAVQAGLLPCLARQRLCRLGARWGVVCCVDGVCVSGVVHWRVRG